MLRPWQAKEGKSKQGKPKHDTPDLELHIARQLIQSLVPVHKGKIDEKPLFSSTSAHTVPASYCIWSIQYVLPHSQLIRKRQIDLLTQYIKSPDYNNN